MYFSCLRFLSIVIDIQFDIVNGQYPALFHADDDFETAGRGGLPCGIAQIKQCFHVITSDQHICGNRLTAGGTIGIEKLKYIGYYMDRYILSILFWW